MCEANSQEETSSNNHGRVVCVWTCVTCVTSKSLAVTQAYKIVSTSRSIDQPMFCLSISKREDISRKDFICCSVAKRSRNYLLSLMRPS